MTKVQSRFRLAKPLDDAMLHRIADAHAVYGIVRIRPDGELLTVEFDATRLRPAEVASTLAAAGIPVQPVA